MIAIVEVAGLTRRLGARTALDAASLSTRAAVRQVRLMVGRDTDKGTSPEAARWLHAGQR